MRSPKKPESPEFRCSRYAPVEFLPEATRFSEDIDLIDPVSVIRLFKRFPQITGPLREATTPEYDSGRPRMEGDWFLVNLAFMLTGLGDMGRFYKRWRSSQLWKVAGFKHGAPSGPTLYLRFVELEQYRDEFEAAGRALIGQARKHESRIGRAAHVDGSGIASHAALEHYCPKGANDCKHAGKATRTVRLGDDLVADLRADEAKVPEEDAEKTPKNSLTRLSEAEVCRLGIDTLTWGRDNQFAWFIQRGHSFRSRDVTASPRMYGGKGAKTKKRLWNGLNDVTATDAFTGAPLAIEVVSARVQEWDAYPNVLERTCEAVGRWPQMVSADRGFVMPQTYEFNTRRGIGSAFPWREPKSGYRRRHYETEEFDRHGIMRCQHCGSPCDIRGQGLGFYFDESDTPRIRGRCKWRGAEESAETQSIACGREWRQLQPLCVTDGVFNQMNHTHASTERVHLNLRQRYTQGGKETVMRNKRLGIECQQLRAAAVVLLEWFRLCLRHGWLGSHKKLNLAAPALRNMGKRLFEILEARKRWALDLPYGEAARACGLGRHGPPGPESPLRKKSDYKAAGKPPKP